MPRISPLPPFFYRTLDHTVSVCFIWNVHCWYFFREWMFERTKKSFWKVLENVPQKSLKSPWKRYVMICGNHGLLQLQDIKDIGSLSLFKKALLSDSENIPSLFYTGTRHDQILHARLRMKCSSISEWVSEWIGCLTSQLTIFQSYMWRHIDVQADWRRSSWTYGRAPTP